MSVLPDPAPGGEPGGPLLPAWAKTLQRRVRQRGIDFFILHGPGVRDLHPLGFRRFGTIGDFLAQVIFGDRPAVVTYDRGAGIGLYLVAGNVASLVVNVETGKRTEVVCLFDRTIPGQRARPCARSLHVFQVAAP